MENISHKRKVTIISAIFVAMFFSAINQTIVGVALPTIISRLGGMEYYSWVITIYFLTTTLATILIGKLSDLYGRKYFILAGIVIFILGAFFSGTSSDIYQLITSRGVQGLGAGIIMSTAFTSIGDLFSPRERGRWGGLMSSIFGVASVLGPGLGGYIVDHMSWRWVFWLFLPLGFVAFFMILVLYPKPERSEGASIDYLGSLFLTLAIVPMLLAFSWAGTTYSWTSVQILGLFALSAVSIVLLIVAERKAKAPVLPLYLFRNDIYTLSNIIGFIMNAGMFSALMYMPFYVQGVLGIAPTYAGYVTMPMSVLMFGMNSYSGNLMTKTGKYKMNALVGLSIMLAGMVLMSVMNGVPMALVSMIVFGFGLGLAMPVLMIAVQNTVDSGDLGVATASVQLFRNLGGTIGMAVMGTIMTTSIAQRIQAAPVFNRVDYDPAFSEKLIEFQNPQLLLDSVQLNSFRSEFPASMHQTVNEMLETLRHALDSALTNIFISGAVVVAIALVLTFFLREIPLRTSISKEPGADEMKKVPEPAPLNE